MYGNIRHLAKIFLVCLADVESVQIQAVAGKCRQFRCLPLRGGTNALLPVTLGLWGSEFLGSDSLIAVYKNSLLVFLLVLAEKKQNRYGQQYTENTRAEI